jgi:osmoprotectant transport system permease protein
MNLIEFVKLNGGDIASKTLQHIVLASIATLIAIVIGIPLGIIVSRRPGLSKAILGFANVMQTIPSLALFAFLISLPLIGGIGARTAIIALVLYSLLPVIRNTYSGISGIDAAIKEAGRGMGMTSSQLLMQVELPLASSVIFSGIRIAMVLSIGTATIAAAIGAGGLGEFIFRGLFTVNNTLILAGAIPAALLALLADALLGFFEKSLAPRVPQ